MYRRAVAWNLSVSYYKKQNTHFIYAAALKLIISKNQSNCEINLTCDMDIPDYNETPRLPRYVQKCNTFSANLTGKLLVPLRCG